MHRNRTWQINPTELRSQRNRILLVEGGDGSVLNLDFTSGILDPRLTLARNSTLATYINSSGFVATATTNEPRFDYSPTTVGELKGLLIEGASTNLLNWSEAFSTAGGANNNWADTNLTRTSTNNTSPRNDATALRITASAANGTIISSTAIGSSAARVLSVWLRRVTGTGAIQFTTDNGTAWTTQVITSSWVRYTFPATTADQRVGFRIVDSGNAIEIWGAQLEVSAGGATSYIPTGTTQVLRNGDFLLSASSLGASRNTEFSLNDITIGISSLSQYTLLYVYGRDTNQKRTFPASLIVKRNTASTIRLDWRDFNGTSVEIKTITATVAATTVNTSTAKIAFSCNGVAQPRVAINGTAFTGTGTIDPISEIQWVQLGNSSAVAGSFNPIWVKQLKIFPTTLSTAQLQALTT
jgi:hypothetical protein